MRDHSERIGLLVLLCAAALAAHACGQQERTPKVPATTTPAKPLRPVVGVLEDRSKVIGGAGASSAPPSVQEMVPFYVFRLAARWPITRSGTTLSVCFDGGAPTLRSHVLAAAREWTQYARVAFDAGSGDPRSCAANDTSTNIRIGFNGVGYWSVVGNTTTTKPHTMNLQGFDAAEPAPADFKKTVLHEFGHALGFEHEHQHPEGGCDDEFDWDTVYPTLEAPPNNWSKPQIDFNLRIFRDSSAYGLSQVDRTSVMHYTLPSWMFKKGVDSKCYVQETLDLSALDKAGAAKYYPPRYSLTNANDEAAELETIAKALPQRGTDAKQFIQGLAARIRSGR